MRLWGGEAGGDWDDGKDRVDEDDRGFEKIS